jgi:hypothetical protein
VEEMITPPRLQSFPVVESVTGGNNNSNATSHTVNLPAGIVANNMLVVVFSSDGNPTITFPAGWTPLFQQANGTAVKLGVWYKIAVGTEGATITVTTSVVERTAHTSYRLSTVHAWQIMCGTATTGVTTQPNPPSSTPIYGAKDYLWIAVCGYDVNRTVSTYPTNYANGRNDYANNAAGCGVGSARRELNATSEDPGVFTISASDDWVANVIAVENAPIDIGGAATDRASTSAAGYTRLELTNPANATGTLDTVEFWAATNLAGCYVGTLYLVSGTVYKCRDFASIGNVTAGSKQTFASLSIDATIGDFIAQYWATGTMELDTSGGSGRRATGVGVGNWIDVVGEEADYDTLAADRVASIYGTGTEAGGAVQDITNDPSTKAFGIINPSSSYYADGAAPSNPVGDGDCTFTITNNDPDFATDIDMKMADFTGGVGWNIAAGAPGSNEVRITAYYSGQDPSAGLVLANADAEFIDALGAGATKKWDFCLETGSSFTDGVAKSGVLTLTAVVED